jgi:tRNA-specific adenosine deaminase 1
MQKDVAIDFYRTMGKNGKPQPHEFTVMACFLLTATNSSRPIVIALGTGTKCLPGSRRSKDGSTVNDCHAEVVARRNLIAWLLAEVNAASQSKPSVLEIEPSSKRFRLRDGYKVHFYVSQPPCGDCAILRSHGGEKAVMLRTGAKSIRLDPSYLPLVPSQSVVDGEEVGLVRRKPGKGEPTLSMSCSDKVARWVLLGVQGSLLSALLAHPIGIETITISLPFATDEAAKKEASDALTQSLCFRLKSSKAAHKLPMPIVSAADPPPPELSLSLDCKNVGSGAVISWHAPQFHLVLKGGDPTSFSLKPIKPASGRLEVLSGSDGAKLGLSKADRAKDLNPLFLPAISQYCLFAQFRDVICLLKASSIGVQFREEETASASRSSPADTSKCMFALVDLLQGSLKEDARSYRAVKEICSKFSGMSEVWKSCPSKSFWLTSVKDQLHCNQS